MEQNKVEKIKSVIRSSFLKKGNERLIYPTKQEDSVTYNLYKTLWKEVAQDIQREFGNDKFLDFVDFAEENELTTVYKKEV